MVLASRDTGVGVWTRGLVRALGRRGGPHEYLIYHGTDAADLPLLESPRARYVSVGVPNALRPARILWEQALLPRRLACDGVDVLHCPAYVCPVRSRVPTVVTVHDVFAFSHPRFCKRLNVLHFRLLVPPGLKSAGVIHCTSVWTKGALARSFPQAAHKARVIYPCVDDEFVPDDSETASLRPEWGVEAPPFLFVGNIEPKKDVPGLLCAYARLKRRFGTHRKLVLVGGRGWRVRPLDGLVRSLGLEGWVVRAGYLPRAELPAIYRASLALVFPSVCEGFGLPPLEAMACGTPVLCSRGSGLAESVGDAALTVPAGEPDALAEAMHMLETLPALRGELREAGLARAAGFRWDAAAGAFEEMYVAAAQGALPQAV
jgi:glycosyltransferase involved in cell wall biosynthesis